MLCCSTFHVLRNLGTLFHLQLVFIGVLLTFSPMQFLEFNVMPSSPDYFNCRTFLSSIGSGIAFLSFGCFLPFIHFSPFTAGVCSLHSRLVLF